MTMKANDDGDARRVAVDEPTIDGRLLVMHAFNCILTCNCSAALSPERGRCVLKIKSDLCNVRNIAFVWSKPEVAQDANDGEMKLIQPLQRWTREARKRRYGRLTSGGH